MSLIAAICTNRDPAAVRPALAALCEQAGADDDASVLLVTSGLDSAAGRLHAEVAKELGARAVTSGPGLSVARNRALEEAADEDVLAFVDDDALPAGDWLATLATRWAEAAGDVACIGGAITPRWERPPPGWVSPSIDTAFSLLDLGPGTVELDPRSGHDAYGANVSFQVGPLREVGGFDPARGHWQGVPLFGDESAVQRLLVERGYRVLYAGDVRVEHQVGADRMRLREVWRREVYRGATYRLDGSVSPVVEAGGAVKAAAGLAVALASRRAPLAGERFVRLAHGMGAVAAPLLLGRLRRRGWPGP